MSSGKLSQVLYLEFEKNLLGIALLYNKIMQILPLNHYINIVKYLFSKHDKYTFKDNAILKLILDLLIFIIIVLLPLIIAIYCIIFVVEMYKKNKRYWWAKNNDRYNYTNSNYNYLKNLYKISDNFILSESLLIYSLSILIFIILVMYIFMKQSAIIEKTETSSTFYSLFYYNCVYIVILFIIVLFYLIFNISKYSKIYKFNNNLNMSYMNYLNKDYMKILCNDFVDENNILTTKCNIKVKPSINTHLIPYLLENANIGSISKDIDLDDIKNEYNSAMKFLTAVITHQWVDSVYKFKDTKNNTYLDNKICKEISIDTILNDEMYNIFYCYPESLQYPFDINIERVLGKNTMGEYNYLLFFEENYEVYTKISNKYIKINTEMSNEITKIKSQEIYEYIYILIIFVFSVLYIIGLFIIFKYGKDMF
jgi:hypothetical protein